MVTKIEFKRLCKRFPFGQKERIVLEDISFNVEEGSFTAVVGPSGCGKSTLLNIVAGIEPPSSGEVHIKVEGNREARVGYVFQAPRLLPWMSVIDNMLWVKPESTDKVQHREVSERYLKMVGLQAELDTFPLQLSGGMQQRVGIARALAINPDVLMMDEPFSHLDEITANNLRAELSRIWDETHNTVVFVTHDLQEGILLADRMLIFGKNGRLLDDIDIDLPRPREFIDPAVTMLLADCTKRFYELQAAVGMRLD